MCGWKRSSSVFGSASGSCERNFDWPTLNRSRHRAPIGTTVGGVKKVWRGWLYNVSGFGVVELKFKNGKRALIGTDEPEKLTGAIEAALAAN